MSDYEDDGQPVEVGTPMVINKLDYVHMVGAAVDTDGDLLAYIAINRHSQHGDRRLALAAFSAEVARSLAVSLNTIAEVIEKSDAEKDPGR